MIEDTVRLDGNAAAGPLSRFFALDPTLLMITCAICGVESPLARLHLFGGTHGIILRCIACGEVNLRAREVGESFSLDSRGAALLTLRAKLLSSG